MRRRVSPHESRAPSSSAVEWASAGGRGRAGGKQIPHFIRNNQQSLCIPKIDMSAVCSVDSVWTEGTDMAALTGVQKQYILHWGEMGTRWGINRTVAQIHALLYLSPRALPAEEIAETLSVARSNVSTSIRELEGWGIVRAVHVLGDRREHYESMKDVWEMFRLVIEQRKRREIDPTREMLRRSLEELDPKEAGAEFTRERLAAMAGFFEAVTELHDQMKRLPTGTVRKLLRMGTKVRKAKA
jgi:DNA-binding transcriptional regulator GbsR (MarR family)